MGTKETAIPALAARLYERTWVRYNQMTSSVPALAMQSFCKDSRVNYRGMRKWMAQQGHVKPEPDPLQTPTDGNPTFIQPNPVPLPKAMNPCLVSSNSMQPDAKVEKKCATSYLMEDMILKSILPFLPIISDSDEVKGHVILARNRYF